MSRSIRRHALVSTVAILAVVVGSAACGQPDFLGPGMDESADTKADTDGTNPEADDEDCVETADTNASDAGDTSADPPPAACCKDMLPGKAHCVTVSPEKAASLDACPSGGSCVPDSLRDGTVPTPCTTAYGPGACVSLCVKGVADQKARLKRGSCGANELCTPCISPLDGKSTGRCETPKASATAAKKTCTKKAGAATDAPAADPRAAEATATPVAPCCGGKGKCIPPAAAGDDADKLEQKECSDDKVCAPTENTDPNFKPKTCKGSAITGKYTGVCISTCLVLSTLEGLVVEQGDCDSDHQCAPCKYPFIGIDTGAPGCK